MSLVGFGPMEPCLLTLELCTTPQPKLGGLLPFLHERGQDHRALKLASATKLHHTPFTAQSPLQALTHSLHKADTTVPTLQMGALRPREVE